MYYDTVAEYDTEIAEVQATIKRVLNIGQNTNSNTGGSSKGHADAPLTELKRYLRELQKERAILKRRIIVYKPGY